jgi:hypothetical protein
VTVFRDDDEVPELFLAWESVAPVGRRTQARNLVAVIVSLVVVILPGLGSHETEENESLYIPVISPKITKSSETVYEHSGN